MEILVISGLSGAGKSCAASCLEDIGYYTVDNMPAAIIPKAAKTAAEPLVENRIPPSPQAFPPRRPGAPRQPVKILQQPPCFSRRHPHIGFKC